MWCGVASVIVLLAGLAGSGKVDGPTRMSPRLNVATPEAGDHVRLEARVFFSGHSLLNNPVPNFVAAIAEGGKTSMVWNQQNLEGSSIEARTRGSEGAERIEWSGYRRGRDREGNPVDVLAELRGPHIGEQRPYDVLIITEGHALLDNVIWSDTVRYLRHYHEQIIRADPNATTYLFESWLSLNTKADPRAWIAYEKAASPAWSCVAERINRSLEAEGRKDRIAPLPAGRALAQLVELATTRGGVPGLTEPTVEQTLSRLFLDEVHLTPLGSYYVALVIYAVVFGQSPSGTWRPTDVDPTLAATLQAIASQFAADHIAESRNLPIDACRAYMRDFVGVYLAYQRNAGSLGKNRLWNQVQWLRFYLTWGALFSRTDSTNPFHYDPKTDVQYWFS